MKLKLHFNLDCGYTVKLIAETTGEQAVLHLLYDMKAISIDRDRSIHETYKRVEFLEIKGKIKGGE